ncbi:MAG: hypothetical protein ILP10_06470 [Lachnospiraceae bacterium]|nr:hypothetical protein [Lachnospiraceae bacterium]
MAQTDEKKDDALRSAYEADKKLKKSKADELKDAKDYVSVLLKEIEVRNDELGNARSDSEDIKKKLDNIESEFVLTKQSEISARKKQSLFTALAIIEGLVIVALIVMLFVKGSGSGSAVTDSGDKTTPGTADVTPAIPGTDGDEGSVDFFFEGGGERYRYVDDLQAVADAYNSLSSKEFTASVESLDGLEHLCLSDKDMAVYFRNEYLSANDPFRRSVTIERDDRRLEVKQNYDLESSDASFAPQRVNIDGRNLLVFKSAASGEAEKTAGGLTIVDAGSFEVYSLEDAEAAIRGLVRMEFYESIEELENSEYYKTYRAAASAAPLADRYPEHKRSVFLVLFVGEDDYLYSVPQEVYNDIMYFEITPPVFEGGIKESITKNWIGYEATVALGEDSLLGQIYCELKLGENGPELAISSYEAVGIMMTTDVDNPVYAPVDSIKEEYRL